MNASALLQAQGWRGEGHTLHATSDSIGLKNRLLVSRKANTSGLGASQYANDQWWLSALDEQLGGLSTKNGKIVQTVKDGKLDRLNDNVGKSELYKFFIRGGTLQGTVDKLPTKDDAASPRSDGRKPAINTKPRAFTTSAKQSETEGTPSSSESSKRKEAKEERRARKEARRQRREQKRARREARKQKSRSTSSTDADESTDIAKAAKNETKEERRARKEAKRKRKEEKRRSRR